MATLFHVLGRTVGLKWAGIILLGLSFGAPEALANYRTAQSAFAQRNYVVSAANFFQAYAMGGNRAQQRKAEWGLAQSLHRLQFYYAASKYYSIIVRRGPRGNPFYGQALAALGNIDNTVRLGHSHMAALIDNRTDPAMIPSAGRGLYFYYRGLENFNGERYEAASRDLRRVPSGSDYHLKALFLEGIIHNLRGQHSRALSNFERVRNQAPQDNRGDNLWEQATLNLGRVRYERREFRRALAEYANIPRESNQWLQAQFEAAWTFFMMSKHNHTLGQIHTIHAPFFDDRFYPESYILQAVTFLRLCRTGEVRYSMSEFKQRYQPTFRSLNALLSRYDRDPRGFFRLVYDYDVGSLNDYRPTWAILDKLSRSDPMVEANRIIRFADQESLRLSRLDRTWAQSGLTDELTSFIRQKKSAAVRKAGRQLQRLARQNLTYLRELSNQTKLIIAEMVLWDVEKVRRELGVGTTQDKSQFIGSLQPLQVGQSLEYWPFEGEYWEDELGGYVYNVDDRCRSGKGRKGNRLSSN